MLSIIRRSGNNSGGSGGSNLLSGDGPPSSALGSEGAFYIDKVNPSLYGPKTNGLWPAPIPLGGTTVTTKMDSTDPFIVTTPGQQTVNLPVANPTYLEMYLNGILQPENLFVLNGSVITVSAGLNAKAGDAIEFEYEYVSTSSGGGSGGSGGIGNPIAEKLTGTVNGSNTVFSLSFTPVANTLSIFVNGLRQNSDDYTLDGKTITFVLAPNKYVDATYFY